MNLLRVVALFVLVFCIAGAATQAPQSVSATSDLQWRECGEDLDCTEVTVPLDYSRPDGRQIEIALSRQKALDPSKRIGTLILNPGGPGGSGWEYMEYWSYEVTDEIKDRFDIIGFDPRGVGRSTALECHDQLLPYVAVDPTPQDEADWLRVERAIRNFADDCKRAGADLLPHLGTLNVVRDIDRIRAALGEEKITYFGYSYGTMIGAYYADMFPNRVRAMVLDAALDPMLTLEQMAFGQAQGFEGALQRYITDCRRIACALTAYGDPAEIIDNILAQLEASPMPAPGRTRSLTAGEYVAALFGSLYSMNSWETLTNALTWATDNDGGPLLDINDNYLGLKEDGTYPNGSEIYNTVTCLDVASVRDIEHYKRLAPKFHARAPHFGSAFAQQGVTCNYWAAQPKPLPRPTARGAPPILVIGTTGDPATPYVWSEAMTSYLQSATLLTYYGEGHTAYLAGDQCIDGTVNKYLMALTMPVRGATCGDLSRKDVIKIYDSP